MDLENFNELNRHLADASRNSAFSVEEALEEIDRTWFREAARRARWMDLLGDYAGSELFMIDGESLLQIVLDDPLLAIGRAEEPSFQILHAFHILERTLGQFQKRSAEFEIVFWNDTSHTTLKTGEAAFVVASRMLARELLLKHLENLPFAVHRFNDLKDPSWLRYEATKKPMFVMVNDGGINDDRLSSVAHQRILVHRMFVFRLLSLGIPIALFTGAEYRDSKILTFVYEQSRSSSGQMSQALLDAANNAKSELDAQLHRQSAIGPFLSPSSKGSVQKHLTYEESQFSSEPGDSDHALLDTIRLFKANCPRDFPIELLYFFTIHCILLRTISVRERARRSEDLPSALNSLLLTDFLPQLFFTASEALSISRSYFEVDGRVFCSLIQFVTLNRADNLPALIGQPVFAATQRLWASIGSPSVDLVAFIKQYPQSPPLSAGARATHMAIQPFHLLPFDNDVFNAGLSLVRVPVHDGDGPQRASHLEFGLGTLFSDTRHWHNNNKTILPNYLGGSSPKALDERHRRRILKQNQRFMTTMQAQAGTLVGASGSSLQQIVIPAVGSSLVARIARSPAPIKATKKGKPPKLSSADKLRQQIANEKTSSLEDASDIWWREQLNALSKMSTSEQIVQMKALFRNKRGQERAMGAEMRLYRIHLELKSWLEDPNHDSTSARDKYTVTIMCMIKQISDRWCITSTLVKALASVLLTLGFGDYASSLLHVSETSDRKISFKFIKLLKSKTREPYYEFMHIIEHPVTWQLRLFGEFMDRSMDSAPDRRVAFDPDAWQRQVLDCIDANDSLLVVAPTSAGKTFISYYAMERVLRDSDDGILVYVAPTKALVTQIAAEVYARFSKNLNGKSCWAIHTRDYRINDPQKCQILVTVPEMLAIMLLSPPLARVWTSRIKRIILDEIHSIGQQEGGAVWEQIILLAPSPIIGLSATIGSPENFNSWLQSVQEAHGYKHHFIQYPHRYSHLRKFYYTLTESTSFGNLNSHRPTDRARFLHPISLLSFGARLLPPDLSLEAGDVLSLYEALVTHQVTDIYDMAKLEPPIFFHSKSHLLRQKDVLEYETEIKKVLSTLIAAFDVRDQSSPLYKVVHILEDPKLATAASAVNVSPSRQTFTDNLIHLVADLHSKNELPAILFNFDRSNCEIMAKAIVLSLETAEKKWRSSSPEWQRKLRDWELWKSRSKERERLAERAKKQKKDQEATVTTDYSWESAFNPDDPSEHFSFAGTHTAYSKAELDEDISEMIRWTSTEPQVLEALRRGIAVHHAGMNKRYRSLVESLFRQGFVRVVIATGTLALGINAPTKTSVFCGDSPFLTALMYRQCAGRAGRRGYDLLGNVVFYGITLDRVQRLVLSKLPSLGGNFPLTSTLTLRLLNLLEGSDYADVAVKAVKSLMSLPRVTFGSDEGKHQLLHHLRFSIEFLRRSRLLDREGKPMNLFAIAAHLYYTEPSNFALVTLLQNGVLHSICGQSSLVIARKDFIMLMAHLFGRRYLSRVYCNKDNIAQLSKKYPSLIILPPLSKSIQDVLASHDKDILNVFVGYAVSYATEYAETLRSDSSLPLSKINYSAVDATNSTSLFRAYLKDTSIATTARSQFTANSGHGDDFKSAHELAHTAREGLYLNEYAIPSLSQFISSGNDISGGDGSEHCLNAYLYDFYIHGQVTTLAAANGIRRGDVWYLLEDFMLTLMTIKSSLEQLLVKASEETRDMPTTTTEDELETDLDSGYGTFDPAEAEREYDGTSDDVKGMMGFHRPVGVTDKDWRIYEVVSGATAEFDSKFKAMWA